DGDELRQQDRRGLAFERARRPRRGPVLFGDGAQKSRGGRLVLKLDDVHVNYGRVQVLRGVSLEVPDGAVVAMLGANGAGKSTLLKAISGIMKPRRGTIIFEGEAISR